MGFAFKFMVNKVVINIASITLFILNELKENAKCRKLYTDKYLLQKGHNGKL